MKKFFPVASLVVGIIGLGVFFKPVIEIICGVGGLILAIACRDESLGRVMDGIRYWGRNIAWINIIWVCLEFGLKMFGIELF